MNTKPFVTALVIGKFYPPHLGHHFLIETALTQSQTVYVLVCHKPSQAIPGSLRADWLRQVHPQATVFEVPDTLGDDDTQAWARFTLDFLGLIPDAVFSSEDYGEPFAQAMGSTHILVDRDRLQIPCSGTRIRANPGKYLDYLAPPVRGYFLPRICLVGAESTGKTSLAEALAQHFSCPWMPEYAREYCARKFGTAPFSAGHHIDTTEWTSAEFMHIAIEHAKREDDMAGSSQNLLIVDTNAFATGLWQERYQGFTSPELSRFAQARQGRYALYILCGNEIPWQQDGTRDGQTIRDGMQERFRQELDRTGRPWILAEGNLTDRVANCVPEIEQAIRNWKPFGLSPDSDL